MAPGSDLFQFVRFSRVTLFGAGLLSAALFFALPGFSALHASGDGAIAEGDIQRGLVRIRVSPVQYSYARPWILESGEEFTITGLVLPGNRILVIGSDVRNGNFLEASRFDSYQKYPAQKLLVDMEANLAILTVDRPEFFTGLSPIPMGEDPQTDDDLIAIRTSDLFRVYREAVHVIEIASNADYGLTHLPGAGFNSDDAFRTGGMLIKNCKLSAYVGYSGAKRVEAIPASTMRAFVERAAEKKYAGFPAQGFQYREMVDPVLREYYGLAESMHGVFVSRVMPGTSAWGVLKKEDILLSIQGVRLDDRGYYKDPDLGRQRLHMLIIRDGSRIRKPGERIKLEIFRDGQRQNVEMTLRVNEGLAERINWLVDGQPPYHIESGFVFLELSVPYLREAYGNNWRNRGDELTYLYNTSRYYDLPGDDRIVVIGSVLPDEANRGMERMTAGRVRAINGEPLRNLAHLRKIIRERDSKKGLVRVDLEDGRIFYLDTENRSSINRRIAQRYHIEQLSYPVGAQ